jgi:sulfate adenylyltransferase
MISAFGGSLVDLRASCEERAEVWCRLNDLLSLQLTARSLCDLESIATGVFSPLSRFMGQASYQRVLQEMRLEDGSLFPFPVILTVEELGSIRLDQEIALRSPTNNVVGWMRVEEIFERNPQAEARQVWGSDLEGLPCAGGIGSSAGYCLSGPILAVDLPRSAAFPELQQTPAEVRQLLLRMGNTNVIAFHATGSIRHSDEEMTTSAVRDAKATLLIHPVVSECERGDVDHYVRLRSYKALADKNPAATVLSLLPTAQPVSGPRKMVWQSIISRNYGANHLLAVAEAADDEAACTMGIRALELQRAHAQELGVQVIETHRDSRRLYRNGNGRAAASDRTASSSVLRSDERERHLSFGGLLELPNTREISAVPVALRMPKRKTGFCVWFTGLPGAGKSSVGEALRAMLMEQGREVTLLDGDVVRTHLSKGLGFSQSDRDTNILRIGFVASEVVKHQGAVICAAVSPYRSTRNQVRTMMRKGSFIEVFVDTPIGICELRDVKGHYAKARAGELRGFTGVDDPYEAPADPEITIGTSDCVPADNARLIVKYLFDKGFLSESAGMFQ